MPQRATPQSSTTRPELPALLASLQRRGTKRTRESLMRYGIVAPKAFGVPVGTIQQMAKRAGRDHALAHGLWKSGWYEARLLASFVDEPARVTPGQMDRWCRDFDNWGICDTVCFHLFDRTPHAWGKVAQWSRRGAEFEKRAAFALMASLALHDKDAADAPFVRFLPLVEAAADDDRNFVKKGVSWGLRSIGMRNVALHGAAVALARTLAASQHSAPRWLGKDVLRGLTAPATLRRLASRRRTAKDGDGRSRPPT